MNNLWNRENVQGVNKNGVMKLTENQIIHPLIATEYQEMKLYIKNIMDHRITKMQLTNQNKCMIEKSGDQNH